MLTSGATRSIASWSPRLRVAAEAHRLCLSRQIRNLTYAVEADGYAGRVWAVEPRHLPGLRDTPTPDSFTRRRRRIENAVDRLVLRTFLPDQLDTANARRLQERYREHRASLLVFLDRPSVIHRKVTGGFRSQLGADVSAILISLLTTDCKQGENLSTRSGPSPDRHPFMLLACLREQILNLNVPEQSQALSEAWAHVARRASIEQRIGVAMELLSEPPEGPQEEPDRALRLWVDVQDADTGQVLHSLLNDADLNDEQIKRIWLQAERRTESLGGSFFIGVIPTLVTWADGAEISRTIFNARNVIAGLFKSEDDRF